jgi:bidirectional [NiFe] hydrogenase diaphorase subunit
MSSKVKITIDGQQYQVPAGEKLLWAALDCGIYIPHLCGNREEERPEASCRLCFVEIEGIPDPVTACTQEVIEGMVVQTRTPRVDRLVGTAFELLLSNHKMRCGKCPQNRRCELQKIARERKLKLRLTRLRPLLTEEQYQPIDDSPGYLFCRGYPRFLFPGVWQEQLYLLPLPHPVFPGFSRAL